MTSPVAPQLVTTDERTHMEVPCKDSSPALEGDRRGSPEKQVSAGSEGDRRRGEPGCVADDGGAFVSREAAVVMSSHPPPEEEEGGRERLKRHRVAMAGRVWIPEMWGQEKLLKDWADCAAIDRDLVPNGLLSARKALVEERRRANSGRIRIENRCLSD